jgi:ribosomal-protein-alanine N-acetyltransferase
LSEANGRVFLRAPERDDEAEFIEAMQASRTLHRPWLYAPQTPEDFREYLVRALRPTSEFFLGCRHEDDAIIGFLNLSEIVRGSFQSAYLGYGAVAAFAGQGYMRDALALVLRETFTRLDLHRVEANIQPDNAASIALVRRSGFELEGVSPRYLKIGGRWRDHERWAIRSETWRSSLQD